MVSKDMGKGKSLNKLINNSWFRNMVTNNIKKRCNINNIGYYQINAAYSSYIGNLQYTYTDPINASIEIGRRAYEIYIKKNKQGFYPIIKIKDGILHQWKEKDISLFKTCKELCLAIKNSKMRYRVPIDEAERHHMVFRQEWRKPMGLCAYICV